MLPILVDETNLKFWPLFFSQKRLNQQKRQRERERKELEHLKRSHLVNMRVVQRNLVYVTGMGARFAKEEVRILQRFAIPFRN